jgi:dihydrofolate synthase/folylpolyglutamate synthase
MNYAECLKYLADLGQELRGVKFGLETISALLASLGDPHRKYPTAIVAGTNGKGSTSAILASILQHAGYRTGLYTSPHLVRVNERIRVNGEEISDEDFARAFTEVHQVVERLLELKTIAQLPSFFEFLTAAAFLHFARDGVQFAVLEVGMGGRLDATNVTEPRIAVITDIALDHVEFLGSTHAAIAAEKAGVIKLHRPVVTSCNHPDAAEVVRRRCGELEADLLETANFAQPSNFRNLDGRYAFDLSLDGNRFVNLCSPLRGKFQVKNTVAAVAAAWRLAQEGFLIPRRAILLGLRRAAWPGRLEPVLDQPLVLLDGAHNPAAARELAEFIRQELAGRRVRLIYASMRDKAIGEISEILFPLAAEVYLTHPEQARAATPEEILAAAGFRPPRVFLEAAPPRALQRACQASSPEDVVLVVGSLFLVGAIKKAFLGGELRVEDLTKGHRVIGPSGDRAICRGAKE